MCGGVVGRATHLLKLVETATQLAAALHALRAMILMEDGRMGKVQRYTEEKWAGGQTYPRPLCPLCPLCTIVAGGENGVGVFFIP